MSKNILIADDNSNIRQLIILSLESEFSINTFEASSGNEAVELLKKNNEIDLVISDYNMPKGNGGMIFQYLVSNNIDIPFILISTQNPEDTSDLKNLKEINPLNNYLSKPFRRKQIISLLKNILVDENDTVSVDQAAEIHSYCKIKISSFIQFNRTNIDIYLKLSNDKVVKVISKQNNYETKELDKYLSKGIEYIYTTQEDFEKYSDSLIDDFFKKFDDPNLKGGDIQLLQLSSLKHVHESLHGIGISEKTIALIDRTVDSCYKTLKEKKSLRKYLSNLIKNESFLLEHSLLTGYLSSAMGFEMGWDARTTMDKLLYSALIHDIVFEKENLAEINDLTCKEYQNLSPAEKKQVENHPAEALKVLEKIEQMPIDMRNIIMHHHERPDGKGFPSKLNFQKFSPISALFNVAHHLAGYLFYNGCTTDTLLNFLDENEELYDKGVFKKAIKALQKCTGIIS